MSDAQMMNQSGNVNVNETMNQSFNGNSGGMNPMMSPNPMMPQVPIMHPPKETMYDKKIKESFHIYGIAALLYACLYAFCMYKNSSGITYGLFVAGSIGFILFCLKKLEMSLKKESWFYMVSMMLLSVSTFCTDDWRIIFLNKTGVFLLTISLLLGIIYDTKQWNLGKFLGSIVKVCVMAIGEVARPFSDAIWYCKNKLDKKNSKYLYVLMGIAITIPLFVIVFLLLTSADAVFRNLANEMLNGLDIGDIYLIVFMIGFMFLASYCLLTYLSKKTLKEEVVDSRKWEPLIGIPVVSILSLLYLVFSVIQIMYLFVGNMQLPEGYTYAEYAREGFFQLLAVSILNLIIVLVGLYFFKPSKVLKVVLTVMSLCTFIMIASSAMRMIIYIQYYYLTFLRILVLWSLVVLFLIFAGVIAYIVKDSFPLFRYSMVVVTCLYLCLSFAHPDYWIAKVNLAGSEETRSEFFEGDAFEDFYYLTTLSADAAPVMVEWAAEEGYDLDYYYTSEEERRPDEKAGKYGYLYLRKLNQRVGDIGIRNFNVSRFIADFLVTAEVTEGM